MRYPSNITKSYLFRLSIPIFFSNLAVPLVGIVDTGLMGHLNNSKFLVATSISTSVMTLILWSFGFLRMGTVGLVSQSLGKGDYREIVNIVVRNLVIAIIASVIIILLKNPLLELIKFYFITSIETQENAKKNNLLTLDAPVSGGVIGADNGSLTFMVGGDEDVYKEIKFLFDIMGNNSILCGKIGAGQSAKICNNLLLATTMIAVGESFSLGKNLGLDLNKLFDVISTSSGSCWAINNYCPIKGVGPQTPSDNDFKGGFSGSLMYKDLGLAIDAAKNTNTNLNYGINTHKKFEDLVNNKLGHLDFSNIINQ